ncbi:MAG: hypothetical protein NW207_07040 [Cytophagales bacterium]|nr:hypothetical protein [Cytophagales bacterium]
MKHIIAPLLLALSIATHTLAQNEVFKVLASKGTNVNNTGKNIMAGSKLMANEEINVGDKSYLALVHRTGKSYQIKNSGKYLVNDLDKQITSALTGSITKKYSDYILTELFKPNNNGISYQKNMKVTGASERAVNSSVVNLIVPKKSHLIGVENLITWLKVPGATKYKVEILNKFEEKIYDIETSDTSFILSTTKVPTTETEVLVKITTDNSMSSEVYLFKIANEKNMAELYKENQNLSKLYTENTAVDYLMLGSFYAQNQFFIEAKKCYETAIALEPDVQEYKDYYRNYLEKNNMGDYYPY